jgi:hypothetical protein
MLQNGLKCDVKNSTPNLTFTYGRQETVKGRHEPCLEAVTNGSVKTRGNKEEIHNL